ncbi:hypothetical protein HDU83_009301 [Entophlyctis luteolus]|nr:hypothetical protein HDU83_009301 [Entophlyctis luteolus]KAJ3393891.1 hypothetical protein HDU84_000854 [Entophlyctis sp. JEL0112]
MHVFPGGVVEDGADGDLSAWADILPPHMLVLPQLSDRIAALRETFEECGIHYESLRNPREQHCAPLSEAERDSWRRRIRADARQFLEFVRTTARTPPCVDAVLPWAHWITPAHEPRRFDTRFFIAVMPCAGATAVPSTGGAPFFSARASALGPDAPDAHVEIDSVLWATPADVLRRAARSSVTANSGRDIALMPPQYVILRELLNLSLNDVRVRIAADPGAIRPTASRPCQPVPLLCPEDGSVLLFPGDYQYPDSLLNTSDTPTSPSSRNDKQKNRIKLSKDPVDGLFNYEIVVSAGNDAMGAVAPEKHSSRL